MFLFKLHRNVRKIGKSLRFYSVIRNNHYDVLKVAKNCTDKEIKEAFIQLSKTYHPDVNKSSHAQEQFIKILEAYNVLSKPSSRARYDSMISNRRHDENRYAYRTSNPYSYRYNYSSKQYYDTHSSTHSGTHRTKSYGLNKIPNYILLMVCFGVAVMGTFLQVIIIRDMYIRNKRKAQEKSKRLAEELERVRAAAQNGNEAQTRMLLEKIVAAANPTIATASLGQTLANEKK